MEYFPRIHHIAALQQKSKSSFRLEDFTGRIIFMSMFNDISWGSEDNEQECDHLATQNGMLIRLGLLKSGNLMN